VSTFAERLAVVQERIALACARAGRDVDDVLLVAVSKTQPSEVVLEAAAAGLRHFGENRVEEAQHKIPLVEAQADAALTWHMIGHLQSRKARDAAPLFGRIHSVDSVRLAVKLAAAVPAGRALPVLLEINISGEESKAGFAASVWEHDREQREALIDALRAVQAMDGLMPDGLMTMAPIAAEMEAVRPVFRRLRLLRDALEDACGLPLPQLSMGMTDDYPVAIEEGATMVRVGRALFGERQAGQIPSA
jgi:pyridoxal phosphate enzyme (YggS family)